jgi:hypothetical protein
MLASKDHYQLLVASGALDLTFASHISANKRANVKSAPLVQRRQFYRLRSVLSCIPRHVGRGCRSRTGYRQVMSLAWLSVPLTRYRLRGLNSLACAAYIRPAQNCMEDGGGVEPLTRRCHGFQDRCPPTQASPSRFMIAHDLRANAFRVCRAGKPLHTPHQVRGRLFPDHAPVAISRGL